MNKIPIVEIFGPVIQGEGVMAGHQTLFLRTGGCDYRCSWCDSMYAVLPEQVKENSTQMDTDTILRKLFDTGPCNTLTISGGNPLMWDLAGLVKTLKTLDWQIAVETQGTVYREWVRLCDVVTVSPKPPSSGMITDWAKLDWFLDRVPVERICLKVVVFDEKDFEYACQVHDRYEARSRYSSFYLQPGTTLVDTSQEDPFSTIRPLDMYRSTILDRTKWLIGQVVSNSRLDDVRVMPQLHSLVYGNIKGV